MAELEFHGAAQTVTGSMHLLHLEQGVMALDCGLMQGHRDESRKWNETFPLPPKDVQAVLLSHAHIDHSGNLPGLVRQGFRGRIHATAATADLCGIMLADSAHIQEEDAKFWNAKRATRPEEQIQPLYGVADALATQPLFSGADYGSTVSLGDGLPGHVPGGRAPPRLGGASWWNSTARPPCGCSSPATLAARASRSCATPHLPCPRPIISSPSAPTPTSGTTTWSG